MLENSVVEYQERITLRNKEIPITIAQISNVDLRFYPENPRIYSIVNVLDEEPCQDDIERILGGMDHVKKLVSSIKMNGGLIEPVLVRRDSHTVIEGNSRLAAYRLLARKDPVKWDKMKCKILPENIGDDDIFSLIGEYHIIGRQDWSPYEQAGYLFRRKERDGISVNQIADEIALSKVDIYHKIKVYGFMVDHNDNTPDRWSYYDVYLKCSDVKKLDDKTRESLDECIVEDIRSGDIELAADIRQDLKVILRAGKKTYNKYLHGKKSFYDCYDEAIEKGAGLSALNKLKETRQTFVKIEDDFVELQGEPQKECVYEIKKLKKLLEKVLRRIT